MDYIDNKIQELFEHSCKIYNEWKRTYKKLPNGSLIVSNVTTHKGNKRIRYFHQALDSHTGKPIRKSIIKNSFMIQSLKLKRLLKRNMPRMERKIKILKNCLLDRHSTQVDEIGALIRSISTKEGNSEWDLLEERCNPFRPENLVHKGPGGYYRSKSEVIIANMLVMHKISFKYEAALQLGQNTIYPDFTIKCRDGRIIYWEHLGMLHQNSYVDSTGEKIQLYHMNGLTISRELLVSADDVNGGIDTDSVERIIKCFLL